MPFLDARGIRLHYASTGRGPVVLLLHDAARSAADWSRVARAVADAGFTAVAVDQRGHGASTRFDASTDANAWSLVGMDAFVQDARAFLPALAPEGAHAVVGHGPLGGGVAAWLAYWEGAPRVARLVTAACPPQGSVALRAWYAKAPRHGGTAYDARLHDALADALAELEDDELPGEFLTQFKGRALAVEGADDPLYNPAQTMLWYGWLRNGSVTRVPGGHDFPHDGGEGERAFTRKLVAFLRDEEASA